MKTALVIKVHESGLVEVNRVPFEKGSLDFYYEQLDCECIDIVHAYGLTIDADIIDETGFTEDEVEAIMNEVNSKIVEVMSK